MSSPATSHQPPVTSASDDEVLVRVDGVGKKFCRSLKKSLWYGVCDIAGELLPGRKRESQRTDSGLLRADGTTKHTKLHEMGTAGGNQLADSGEFLEGHSQAGLQMDSEKLAAIRSANDPSGSSGHSNILKNVGVNALGLEGDGSGLDGEAAAGEHSVILKNVSINSDGVAGASAAPALDAGRARLWNVQPAESEKITPQAKHIPSGSTLVSPKAPPSDWVYALKDVSFEVRRGWGWVAGFGCFVNSCYLMGSGCHSVILKNVGMDNRGILLQDNGL